MIKRICAACFETQPAYLQVPIDYCGDEAMKMAESVVERCGPEIDDPLTKNSATRSFPKTRGDSECLGKQAGPGKT
jgi:hypothetical protein